MLKNFPVLEKSDIFEIERISMFKGTGRKDE